MITTELPKRIKAQVCPICHNEQDVIINGWEKIENGHVTPLEDKGYSFCNCHNIYFTDWSNINQGTYDPDYYKKYDAPHINKAYKTTFDRIYPKLHVKPLMVYPAALEIGAISPVTLDLLKEKGFTTAGLDIIEHPLNGHDLVVGDFENLEPTDKLFDLIWASHVFEHLKDPIQAVKKCNALLNEDGVLYVAMPDPHFIDHEDPYKWGHWHLREHHILWDMDSFCDVLKENGFEIEFNGRNTHVDQICTLDFSIIARKKRDV